MLLEYTYANQSISLTYCLDGLTDGKVASTPLEPNTHLVPGGGTLLSDPTSYRQLIGSLVYIKVTCPDIVYAIHIVS